MLVLHVIRAFQVSFSVNNTSLEEYLRFCLNVLHTNLGSFLRGAQV